MPEWEGVRDGAGGRRRDWERGFVVGRTMPE